MCVGWGKCIGGFRDMLGLCESHSFSCLEMTVVSQGLSWKSTWTEHIPLYDHVEGEDSRQGQETRGTELPIQRRERNYLLSWHQSWHESWSAPLPGLTAFLCLTYRAKAWQTACWQSVVNAACQCSPVPTFRLSGSHRCPSHYRGMPISFLCVPHGSWPMGLLAPELWNVCAECVLAEGEHRVSFTLGLWLFSDPAAAH